MEIQSLSICCPSLTGCINNCKTCTARQHDNPYKDKYDATRVECFEYWEDVKKRMIYAQKQGCQTVMLTGSNEPQQNRRWLETLYYVMQSLPEKFVNIEMQTTGALLDYDYITYLKRFGVTTIAVSAFNIYDDKVNRDIEENVDKGLNLEALCRRITSMGITLRLCLNVTDYISESIRTINITSTFDFRSEVTDLLNRCHKLGADQVTFRKMWSAPGTPEAEWIANNCKFDDYVIDAINKEVMNHGTLICKLPYGASRYDFRGFSIVVDTDSMAKDENNLATKYYIIREDGKMYSSWDSKASIVF